MVRLVFEVLLYLILFVLQLAGLALRAIPYLIAAARYLVLLILRVSYVILNFGFSLISQLLRHDFLLRNPWRTIATTGLMLIVGVAAALLTRQPLLVVVFCAHGAIVGFVWDQLGPPTGPSFGV